MATRDESSSARSGLGLVARAAFIAAVMALFLVSTSAGVRGIGVALLASAYLVRKSGRVPLVAGFNEVRATGRVASILAIAMAGLGLALVVSPETFMNVVGLQ
jgi:hypothetical protein